jgi:hypothetical protein
MMLPGKKRSRKGPVSKKAAAQKKKAPTRSVNHSPKGARFLLVLATFMRAAGALLLSIIVWLIQELWKIAFERD